jgi:hypothetical protein
MVAAETSAGVVAVASGEIRMRKGSRDGRHIGNVLSIGVGNEQLV